MTNSVDNPKRPLLVTVKSSQNEINWATVIASGAEALAYWQRERQTEVFCDFGSLTDRMSGVRVARAIRALCPETKIYLLTEVRDAAQLQWGLNNGATEVIERAHMQRYVGTFVAVSQAVESAPNVSAKNEDNAADFADLVTKALAVYMGPVAALEVADVLADLTQEARGALPSLAKLALKVSQIVPQGVERKKFLKSLGVEHEVF